MALTELEAKECERTLEAFLGRRRPPPHIRPQLDIGYRISGQSVEIFDVRPETGDPKKAFERGVAKATFVRTEDRWRVF